MIETAEIQALGGRGEGVVRGEGKVVFVPGAMPGERVRYDRIASKGRFDTGVLIEVLDPLPERRFSPCAHDRPAGCGGCSLLIVEPGRLAQLKTDALGDQLERNGVDRTRLEAPRIAGTGLGYRNHARFGVVSPGRLSYVGRPDPAAAGRRGRIPIDTCIILHPGLDALRGEIDGKMGGAREIELRIGAATGERLVMVRGDALPRQLDPASLDASVVWEHGEGMQPLRGFPWIHEEVAGVRFRLSAGAFFQVNTEGAEILVALVREMAEGAAEGVVLDLYAGVGLFSLAAFPEALERIVVESDPVSLQDLRVNAEGARGVSLRGTETLSVLEDLIAVQAVPEFVVADPPRSGLGPAVVDALARLGPPRLVLVSCDGRHFARDLAGLQAHGFAIERIVPIDQFGGTHHLEAVASLRRG